MQRLDYTSQMNAEIHTAPNYIHLPSIKAAPKCIPISLGAWHQTRNRHRPEDFIPACFVEAIIDHQLVIAFGQLHLDRSDITLQHNRRFSRNFLCENPDLTGGFETISTQHARMDSRSHFVSNHPLHLVTPIFLLIRAEGVTIVKN